MATEMQYESLDQDQATMYRWMRRAAGKNKHMFQTLTGRTDLEFLSELQIDEALQSAFERSYVATAADDICLRSTLRQGKLPASLGSALEAYVQERQHSSTFTEGLGGLSYSDVDKNLKDKFLDLCNEIAKLR